jgi:integrase
MSSTELTRFRFIKKTLDALPIGLKRVRYYDEGMDGLVLEVAQTGIKVFRVYKKIKGRTSPVTITLGRYPAMSIENARAQALENLNRLSVGINPNVVAKVDRVSSVSLETVFQTYVANNRLREQSLRGYRQCFKNLADWHKKPLKWITDDLIKQRHQKLTKHSPAQADYTMRLLRALFNFAAYEYKDQKGQSLFPMNPVKILSHLRMWNHVERRHTRIERRSLSNWFAGVGKIRNTSDDFAVAVCDMLEMALLTGLRRSELLGLTWERVNFEAATFWISETKNGLALELPLSEYLATLLHRRYNAKNNSPYVFNADNDFGVVREPKKVIQRVIDETGIEFTMHDLRRTFTTTAEALNVGTYTLKRLLNHRTRRDDVTAGYTVLTPEELRDPSQRIENEILVLGGIKAPQKALDQQLSSVLDNLTDDQKRKLLFDLSAQLAGINEETEKLVV